MTTKPASITPSTPSTRKATPADIPAICEVLEKSWESTYRGMISDDYLDALTGEHWREFLTTGMKNEEIAVIVLEESEWIKSEIIGAAILSKLEKEIINLLSFYLLPSKIAQGNGHILYQAIEEEITRQGKKTCTLSVLPNNKRAKKFYESHGFNDTKEEITHFWGDKEYVCNIYEKRLIE